VAAAILVPLVTVIYLYDVDVYEDEPIRVVALTFLWGALVGVLFSYSLDHLVPVSAARLRWAARVTGTGGAPFPWIRGIVAPIVAVLLMAAGPLVLLPYKSSTTCSMVRPRGRVGVAFVGAQDPHHRPEPVRQRPAPVAM